MGDAPACRAPAYVQSYAVPIGINFIHRRESCFYPFVISRASRRGRKYSPRWTRLRVSRILSGREWSSVLFAEHGGALGRSGVEPRLERASNVRPLCSSKFRTVSERKASVLHEDDTESSRPLHEPFHLSMVSVLSLPWVNVNTRK